MRGSTSGKARRWRNPRCARIGISLCIGAYSYIQACICESGSKRVKERVRVKAREPLSFPPTAYPPPLLDGAGERKEREREEEREEERKEERKEEWREREKRNTDGQGIVCDFVLPLAATSRSHSSISHTPCFLRCSARSLTEVSSYVSTVRKRRKLCAKERKVA